MGTGVGRLPGFLEAQEKRGFLWNFAYTSTSIRVQDYVLVRSRGVDVDLVEIGGTPRNRLVAKCKLFIA